MRKTAIFTMFLMIFGLIGLAESADLLSNGDFENWTGNTPDSWTTIDNEITVTSNTSTVYQGSYSASVEVTTDTQENTDLRQTVSVTNGTQYFVSVWIYHTEGNMKARLYVGGFENYSDNSTTGSWQQLSITYTASTTGSIEVGLRFYDQTGFDGSEIVYVDGFAMTNGTPNAWINEIHYDNSGTDSNEGVEIVIQNAYSYNLSNFKITLYRDTGSNYETHTVDGFTEGTTSQGFTLYYKMISAIQNGPSDGLALSYDSNLISGQCLSYEGMFTATDGDANGITSTDIGVEESDPGTTSAQSLQLTGNGTQYSDFTWQENLTQTWGTLNNGGDQSLPVELTSFTASQEGNAVVLEWVTESEIENLGFIIERKHTPPSGHPSIEGNEEWAEIASYKTHPELQGQGSVTHRTEYQFVDSTVEVGKTYNYNLADVSYDGKVEYHALATLTVEGFEPLPDRFTLYQNYPNPFNAQTIISYYLPNDANVTVAIYDITGRKLETLVSDRVVSGRHKVRWDASYVASGVYIYRVSIGFFGETEQGTVAKKLVLLK